MTTPPRTFVRPARAALLLAATGAGIALAGSASAASATCTAPATAVSGGACRAAFTASGTFTVPAGVTSAHVLVVGGGGGGAMGGGGGGEVVVKKGVTVTPAAAVAVTVGAGATAQGGASGGASSFGTVSAAGGGAASDSPSYGVGGSSGSSTGGVGAQSQTSAGGGGAGAAGNGLAATIGGSNLAVCGVGGPGVDVSTTFPGLTPSTFGGGGGGAVFGIPQLQPLCAGGIGGGGGGGFFDASNPSTFTPAVPGTPNTGGGAGGGSSATGGSSAGGSGIVVVQFTPGPTTPTLTATVLVPRKALVTGQSTKLAIRATNTGTNGAAAVTSCVAVPANLVITRLGGGTRAKGTVCFTVGDLAAGATATRSVTVRGVALRKVTRKVGGSVTATGLTTAVQAAPVGVSIRPRAVRKVVVTG